MSAVSDSVLSTYTASDGDNLAVQDWPLPEGRRLRGVLLLVHGLGEHAWRYDPLAQRLNAWGFAVRGYDQYGHGESGGVRGAIPSPMRLVDDLADIFESTRARLAPGTPLILLGQSVGGLVASTFVALREPPVDGLVLTSPALAASPTFWQRMLLAVLPRIAPNLAVHNGVDPDLLSHDPAVAASYRADPRVHDRVTGRLARFIIDAGPQVLAHAAHWRVPTLLMYGGADRVIDPAGSRAFAQAAPARFVTTRCFDGLYHEILNELDAEPVYACLKQWLDARFPAASATTVPRR